jgi:hypothetical protein
MQKLCAMGLVVVLWGSQLRAEGPLARSAALQISKLAAQPTEPNDRSGWRAVRLLEPGSRIVVTTAEATVSRKFVAVDDVLLTVRNGSSDERIAVDSILEIESRVRRGSALAAVFGTLGGIWLGSAMALGVADSSRCYDGCGPSRLAVWSSVIGVPVAVGYGSWRASSHLTEEVIYRRSRQP